MNDKLLKKWSVILWIAIILISLVTLGILIHNQLTKDDNPKLKNSIYCSKQIEIGVYSLSNKELSLRFINKTDKNIKLSLNTLKVDNVSNKTKFYITIEPNSDGIESIALEGDTDINFIDCKKIELTFEQETGNNLMHDTINIEINKKGR